MTCMIRLVWVIAVEDSGHVEEIAEASSRMSVELECGSQGSGRGAQLPSVVCAHVCQKRLTSKPRNVE